MIGNVTNFPSDQHDIVHKKTEVELLFLFILINVRVKCMEEMDFDNLSNSLVVHLNDLASPEYANQLAERYGFVNVGQVGWSLQLFDIVVMWGIL